jgi:parallel beta-helix repeat protein
MSLLSWLQYRTTIRPPRGRAQHQHAVSRFRPQLETLEDRCLPSTLTVTNNLDSGPGSLRAEIAAAQNKDTIIFAPSLDGKTITLTSGDLSVTTGVTIQGLGANQLTVKGSNLSHVFEINASQPVVLSGMTITNPRLWNSGNRYAGAIDNSTTLTISGCAITNNLGYYGGGIYNSGTLTVINSTLSGNKATYGGGIYTYRGTAMLTNCTIANNSSYGDGGGLYLVSYSTATLTNCTVSGNVASRNGGGICEMTWGAAILNLTNTIVAGNRGGLYGGFSDIEARVTTADHCLVGDGTDSGLVYGVNGNIVGNQYNPINARLGPLQNNGGLTQTMALLAGSPAIGHADNSKAPATDQRGVTRLDEAGETTDIGAFEL